METTKNYSELLTAAYHRFSLKYTGEGAPRLPELENWYEAIFAGASWRPNDDPSEMGFIAPFDPYFSVEDGIVVIEGGAIGGCCYKPDVEIRLKPQTAKKLWFTFDWEGSPEAFETAANALVDAGWEIHF